MLYFNFNNSFVTIYRSFQISDNPNDFKPYKNITFSSWNGRGDTFDIKQNE